jgi:hypothetical protein
MLFGSNLIDKNKHEIMENGDKFSKSETHLLNNTENSKYRLIVPTINYGFQSEQKSCETILMMPSNYKIYTEEEIHQIKANSFSSSLLFLILSLCFFGLLYFYLFKLL